MKRTISYYMLTSIAVLCIVGCKARDANGMTVVTSPSPTPTVTPTPSPTPTASSAIISSAGGSISLAGVAQITFPAGSVPDGTTVSISQTTTPKTDEAFVDSVGFLSAANISNTGIEIRVSQQPSAPIKIVLNAGAPYTRSVPAGQATRVLGTIVNSSDSESDSSTYELITTTVSADTVTFSAGQIFFTQASGPDTLGQFFLATSPGSN